MARGVLLAVLAALGTSAANNNNNQGELLLRLDSSNNNNNQGELLHLDRSSSSNNNNPGSPWHSLDNNSNNNKTDGRAASRVLARRRRYVLFLPGSSIQLVYCMSVRAYIPFQSSMFAIGLTAGLAWQLPTEPEQLYLQRRDAGRHPDRNHRVNLFRSVQTFLSQRGFHGEQCVQRTVCESSWRGGGGGGGGKGTFMEELMSVLFDFPETRYESETPWDSARYNGTSCERRFPRCDSILDITLPIEAIKQ